MASSSHIQPGEKGKILAKVDIKGHKGFISKKVRVFTNDPNRPTVNLYIKAFIP